MMPPATTVYEVDHQMAAPPLPPLPEGAGRSTPRASRSDQVVVVNRAFFAGAAVVVAHGKFYFWPQGQLAKSNGQMASNGLGFGPKIAQK